MKRKREGRDVGKASVRGEIFLHSPSSKSFSSSKVLVLVPALVLVILILTSLMYRYEERIIELHSVIAELSKKMEEEKDDVIKEESECDESQV